MTRPDQDPPPADPAGEAAVDEFVDYFNARDLDGIVELVDPEVTSGFFGTSGSADLIQGLSELLLDYPGIILTRGEVGPEPVAVAWIPTNNHSYSRMGYFAFAFNDDDDGGALVEHIEYNDVADEEGLLAEEPDAAEMAEWEDWDEWDSGEDSEE